MVYVTSDRSSQGNSIRVPEQPNHDGMLGNKNGKDSDTARPSSLLASGVPRIVILDENAVYDHYMRRLNEVWMRRIKVTAAFSRVLNVVQPHVPALQVVPCGVW